MLLLSLPAAEGGKCGTPLGDDEAPREAKKQKTVRAMAKSEMASLLHDGRMQ